MEDFINSPTIEELSAKREVHGELIGFSYSASSNGMAMNSNSLHHISVDMKNGEQIITHSEKAAFGSEVTKIYKAAGDVLSELRKVIDRENISAWDALKFVDMYQMTDYSSSHGMTLYFKDDPDIAFADVRKYIDLKAVSQQGRNDVTNELHGILTAGIESAELISEETKPSKGPNMLFMGMGTPNTPGADEPEQTIPDPNTPRCPSCGYSGEMGKFCPECGSRIK